MTSPLLMKSIRNAIQTLGSICLSLCSTLDAQDEASAPVEALDDLVIHGFIPIEESILPTSRPFNSVYGYDMSILDTPRNVTIISRDQLDAISIQDPRDISKLTSSSYTASNFGAPTTPSIRGQIADTLVNGMRKGLTSNGNGLPLNFNSVESINILKGPPSVMIGVSQYVGGYVDLITKKPTFDRDKGALTATVDSEGMRKAEIDQNFVISNELAIRVSLTGEDSTDYYWDDYKRQTTAFYAALTWIPNENYTLELNTEYFKANYTDNWGINRPTDDLIDHRTYVTGIGSVNIPNELTTTGTTKIDRETRLHGKGDDSNGESFSLQAIQTFTGNPDITVVNNSLFQYLDRDTYSSYQYSEVLRDNTRFENRTEFRTDQETKGLLHKLNLGISLSYQDVWAANDYFNEPANAWDLANQSYSDIGMTDGDVFGPNIYGGYTAFPISGEGSRGKLSGFPGSAGAQYPNIASSGQDVWGNGDSNDSQTATAGLFVQDNIEIGEHWRLLLGGRLDYVHVESEDPMFKDMIRYLSARNPETDYAGVKRAKDTHGDFVPNFNVGLIYKISATKSLYTNYNYSESIPAGTGGGVPLDEDVGNTSQLYEDGFDVKSELYEIGFKSSFLDNTAFFSATVFHQTRTDQQSQGPNIEIEASGFETELSYQPSRKLFLVAGYSYIDSTSKNGLSLTKNPIDSVDPVGGVYGYSNNFTPLSQETRTPGLPRNIFNGLASYRWTDQLSTSLGFLVTSPITLGYNVAAADTSSAEIPWQYSADFGIKYETKRYAIKLSVLNLTDEENWGAVNGLYGNDSIYAELPRRYELSATVKW